MSRTYKDVSWKYRKDHYRWDHDTELVSVPYTSKYLFDFELVDDVVNLIEKKIPFTWIDYRRLKVKTTKPKRRKEVDTEWHWMTTPSWWNRCFNNVPQRRKGRAWERKVLFEANIEETDPPVFSKKPHKYYW